jgi:hypothetical protein
MTTDDKPQDTGASVSPTGLSQAEPVSRLGPTGFDPSRRPLLEAMCRARAGASQGYYCAKGEGFEKALSYGRRWAPKLGKHVVTLERNLFYSTRQEAIGAAREYRRQCREKLAAIAMEARQGRDGETRLDGEAATARASEGGIAHD